MKNKLVVAILLIAGWALATRALRGRRHQPETLREQAERLARDPKVQKKVKQVAKRARKRTAYAVRSASKARR